MLDEQFTSFCNIIKIFMSTALLVILNKGELLTLKVDAGRRVG